MLIHRLVGSFVIGLLINEVAGHRYLVTALVCVLWNIVIDGLEKASAR